MELGDERGRRLGFPTANLAVGAEVDLVDGVYSGEVELEDGTRHPAAISVGRRPHYYEAGKRLVEAYLLDFDGDLYGQNIEVDIGELIRAQRSFDSEDELVAQIADDVAVVRRLQG